MREHFCVRYEHAYHSHNPADKQPLHPTGTTLSSVCVCMCVCVCHQVTTSLLLIPGHSGLLKHGATECKHSLINTARLSNLLQ